MKWNNENLSDFDRWCDDNMTALDEIYREEGWEREWSFYDWAWELWGQVEEEEDPCEIRRRALECELEEIQALKASGEDAILWIRKAVPLELAVLRDFQQLCKDELAEADSTSWFHVDVQVVNSEVVMRLVCSSGYSTHRTHPVKLAQMEDLIPLLETF